MAGRGGGGLVVVVTLVCKILIVGLFEYHVVAFPLELGSWTGIFGTWMTFGDHLVRPTLLQISEEADTLRVQAC